MHLGSAKYRLLRDLLFNFVIKEEHRCFRCGGELTRDTFSIEHKENWLYSGKEKELFFGLDNIAYSHFRCNAGARRRNVKGQKYSKHGTGTMYIRYRCRCPECSEHMREYRKKRAGVV